MRLAIILLLLASPMSLSAQAETATWRNTVDKVCGVVARREVANTNGFYYSSFKPLSSGVTVALYRREKKKGCCKLEQLVAQERAAEDGHFRFVDATEGEYWVAVSEGKKTRKLPITLKAATNRRATDCSAFVYEIDGGDLRLKRMYRLE